jgi:D-alanyl-D-alanine carboxypeptidase
VALLTIAIATCQGTPVAATPALTMDVTTGEVLYAQDATRPWFPASTTKLMTVYVALSAVRDHQIAMNTPLVVSARAHMMPPSKMGFPVGTQVTLENALKMLMVPSANDIAITVAEGIAGSVEAFADDMNRAGAQLGLHESHFVNPNGLPDPDHYSSARDMAIIARALYADFPEQAQLFNLGALSLGGRIIPNHNNLLGRYPGVDGMKTGFTCAAGFNIVASGFRDGRRLVVVVFGAPSVGARSAKVAALFDRGFAGIDRPSGSILSLAASNASAPPDMRNQVCHNRAGLIAQFDWEVNSLDAPLLAPVSGPGLGLSALSPERAFLFSTRNVAPTEPMALKINSVPPPVFDPTPVHIGAELGYTGVVAQARAPHTAIGSEPQPATAAAYAAAPADQPLAEIAGSPLKIDANALPLRGRRARLAKLRLDKAHRVAKAQAPRPALRAAAEAPKTQVLAGAEPSDKVKTKPHKPTAKVAAKPTATKATAAKTPVTKKIATKPVKATLKKAAAAPKAAKVKAASE